jgi:hypothetical protein
MYYLATFMYYLATQWCYLAILPLLLFSSFSPVHYSQKLLNHLILLSIFPFLFPSWLSLPLQSQGSYNSEFNSERSINKFITRGLYFIRESVARTSPLPYEVSPPYSVYPTRLSTYEVSNYLGLNVSHFPIRKPAEGGRRGTRRVDRRRPLSFPSRKLILQTAL